MDLGVGVVSGVGAEARLRAAYSITDQLDAFGQAWAKWNQRWETGAMVGLEYRW